MKPPPFEYFAPGDIDQAIALREAQGEDARYLAGGQSLVPMLNFRVAAPSALIDLNAIPALRDVGRLGDGRLALGAMVRMRRIETDPAIAAANPLVARAASHVAHVQIRNRGTIGGSVAHADPAAELPGIVLACGADIEARGPGGARTVPATEFFHSVFTTALQEGELIARFLFPEWPPSRRWGFREVSRREGDFAMVGIAAWYDTDAAGRIADARLVAIGAGDTPLRLPGGEAVLVGEKPSPGLFEVAALEAQRNLRPKTDLHASAEYRQEVGAVLVYRCLVDAMERGA
jgi:carbon-monoxide dehydrogenase medium subunit